jgi:hypothetical protein
VKLSILRLPAYTEFGKGFSTKVIDLSQPKHRLVVSSMDLDPKTGVVTILPTAQMGIMNGHPRPMYLLPNGGLAIEARKDDAEPKV